MFICLGGRKRIAEAHESGTSITFLSVRFVPDGLVMDSSSSGTLGRRGLKGSAGMRRQRSLEWRQERGYSSSEEEIPARPLDSHVFASLLAQAKQEYSSKSYLSNCTLFSINNSLWFSKTELPPPLRYLLACF